MNRIEEQFSKRLANEEKLFIPYIMAGDGGIEHLEERLIYLEKLGAAAIEIGVPFSDPVADGPTIQQAGIRSLQNGTTLKGILSKVKEIRSSIKVPLVLMTYMNPILAYGIERFVKDLKEIGMDGCIIPDLPIEEEEIIAPKLEEVRVELIRLVTMVTPKERIEKIAKKGNGFLYTVTVKGITGVRKEFDNKLLEFLKIVKTLSNKPIIAGFGISDKEQVEELIQHCDGVVVGSKIVELLNENNFEEIEKLMGAVQSKDKVS